MEFKPLHDGAVADATLYAEPMAAVDEGDQGGGSMGVGEVNQITPTTEFRATT